MGTRKRSSGAARRFGTLAVAAAAVAAVAPPAAQADTWGYEQVTPADGGQYLAAGLSVSNDGKTVNFEASEPLPGDSGDGRGGGYWYGMSADGDGWNVFQAAQVGSEFAWIWLIPQARMVARDGSAMVFTTGISFDPGFRLSRRSAPNDVVNLTPEDDSPPAPVLHTPDLETLVYRSAAANYVTSSGEVVNVDGSGSPMQAGQLGGGQNAFTTNAMTADGTKVIFASSTALDGDEDGAQPDIYQRDLAAGTTRLISDDTPGADPDGPGAAQFRWASADQSRVMWSTTEQRAGDTDNAADLYVRDGNGPIVRISQGETVDGSPTGNANAPAGTVDWVATSEDGNRVFFVAEERLTQDAPAAAGKKLYERDIAGGVTRFVAGPLATTDLATSTSGSLLSNGDPSFRGIRITSWGAVLQSRAPLAGDSDGDTDIFAWTRDGGLQLITTSPAAAVGDGNATLVASRNWEIGGTPLNGGRSLGGPGDSRIFFTTAESLAAEDTDGGRRDVYAWSPGGAPTLVSPRGDAQHDALYFDNTDDGSRVFFHTTETVLPSDVDGGVLDVYAAVLGGGSAPSKPVPPAPPAGPAPAPGPVPQVPDTPVPASGTPKPAEPAPIVPPVGPAEHGDDGDGRAERASLRARVARRLGADGARLSVRASAAGELRIRAVARLRRDGKLRKTRIAEAEERIAAGERTRFDVALSDAALERLEKRGRLRVRFVVRLVPSGEQRAAKERVTVTLRSGQRR